MSTREKTTDNPKEPAGCELSASAGSAFVGGMATIERLLQERGFSLARGTYHHGNGDKLPTVVIARPDTPEWLGVWMPWESAPELPGEVAGEAQAAFELAGKAIGKWDADAWMYEPNQERT